MYPYLIISFDGCLVFFLIYFCCYNMYAFYVNNIMNMCLFTVKGLLSYTLNRSIAGSVGYIFSIVIDTEALYEHIDTPIHDM